MPKSSSVIVEVPAWVSNPVIVIGRSGIQNIFDKQDIALEVRRGGAEWLGACTARVRYATGVVERRTVNRARLTNPAVPGAPEMRGLSAKMSPPNPRDGAGNYNQSADIAYYRFLDCLVTGTGWRRAAAILGFWSFSGTHASFLAHVRRRLDQLHAKPTKYGIRTRGAAPRIQQRRKETK